MSWLSDFLDRLNPSSREEHFWAKIAGEEELENDIIPSSREEGFMYKIAQKIQGGSLPDASEASEGDVLTIDDGEPVWAVGGGGAVYATFTENGGTWTCDKTYAELKAAYDSGSIIFGACQTLVFPMLFLTAGGHSGFSGTATLARGDSSITSLSYYQFAAMSDGAVYGQELIKEFPT